MYIYEVVKNAKQIGENGQSAVEEISFNIEKQKPVRFEDF